MSAVESLSFRIAPVEIQLHVDSEVPSKEILALGCSAPLEPSAGRRHFLLRGTDFAESDPHGDGVTRCGHVACPLPTSEASGCAIAGPNHATVLSILQRKSPGCKSRPILATQFVFHISSLAKKAWIFFLQFQWGDSLAEVVLLWQI